MREYMLSGKIASLLAFSLSLALTAPLCQAEEMPQAPVTEAREVATAPYTLNFDSSAYHLDKAEIEGLPLSFRTYEGCRYTAYPANDREKLDYYVPEAYFNKQKINGFSAATAPILMPLALNGSTNAEDLQALILQALGHGYVVAVPVSLEIAPDGAERLGKAPLYLLEAKAAIRYLQRNHHRLPAGNLSRLAVWGEGLGGSLALQLAASCNQQDYVPYLRGLGAAERSDHIFAAQAYGPQMELGKEPAPFGWLLPDGRPDPYAVSRYAPLVDLDATLARSLAPSPTPEESIQSEAVIRGMDGSTKKDPITDEKDAHKAVSISNKAETRDGNTRKEPAIIYNTKEYQDYLDRQAACQEAEKEYQQFIEENTPPSQNANYLRICTAENTKPRDLQKLKESFAETGTEAEAVSPATTPQQDIRAFFAWLDEAVAQRDAIDLVLGKELRKQQAKVARARLLRNRAALKAQKKQARLERRAKEGELIPYDTIALTK